MPSNERLAVLLLPESPCPPTCGNALRDVQQVTLLRRLGYDVTLLCVRPRLGSSAAADRDAAAGSGMFIAFVADEVRDHAESWKCRLRRKMGYLKASNTAHPFGWWLFPYCLCDTLPAYMTTADPGVLVLRSLFLDQLPGLRRAFAGKIIVDCHDDDVHLASEMIRSVPWWQGAGPLANYRGVISAYRKHLPLADEIWAVSATDARRLGPFAGSRPVLVVPSAVDENEIADAASPGTDNVCAMVANYAYGPNLNGARWLVSRVWPLVLRACPKARLHLVGGGAETDVAKLASSAPRVIATGRVGDLSPIYAEAGLMLAPLFEGGGSRLKIVEAWKHGKAVLTTAKGIEGILAPSNAAEVQDEPHAFAAALTRLMGDRTARARLGDAGRRFVADRLSFRQLAGDLASRSLLALPMSGTARVND